MRRSLVASLLLLATALAPAARAHEARPGFLELRETGPETYSFLWKKKCSCERGPVSGHLRVYRNGVLVKTDAISSNCGESGPWLTYRY